MKQSAYAFATEVDRQIESLPRIEYLCRAGRSKRLQEELLPISRLGLHLKLPGLDVEVEAFEDNGEADGYIRVSGFRTQEFNVQVTCDYSYEESLRNELLISEGCTPGSGEIFRDRKSKRIIAITGAVDSDEHILRIASSVVYLFQKKNQIAYRRDTALIIAFNEIKLYASDNWQRLFSALSSVGGLNESSFTSVYLFNGATNEIHRVA